MPLDSPDRSLFPLNKNSGAPPLGGGGYSLAALHSEEYNWTSGAVIFRRMKKFRFSKLAWELVCSCLEVKTDKRPEIREIIHRHPWFHDYVSYFPEENRIENKEEKAKELNPMNIKQQKRNPVCDCSHLKMLWKNQELLVSTNLTKLLTIAGAKRWRQKYTNNTSIWQVIRQCGSTLDKLRVYQNSYCIRKMNEGLASSLQKQVDRTNYLCTFWTTL